MKQGLLIGLLVAVGAGIAIFAASTSKPPKNPSGAGGPSSMPGSGMMTQWGSYTHPRPGFASGQAQDCDCN